MKTIFDNESIASLRESMSWSQRELAASLRKDVAVVDAWEHARAVPTAVDLAMLYDVADSAGVDFTPFIRSRSALVRKELKRLEDLSSGTFEDPAYPYRAVVLVPTTEKDAVGCASGELRQWIRRHAVEYDGYGGAEFPYGAIHAYPGISYSRPDSRTLALSDQTSWPSSSYDRHYWFVTTSAVFGSRSSLQEESMELGSSGSWHAGPRGLRGTMTIEWMPRDIVYALLFGAGVASSLQMATPVALGFRWTGLRGRRLTTFPGTRYRLWPGRDRFVGLEDEWHHVIEISGDSDLEHAAKEALVSCAGVFGATLPLDSLMDDVRNLIGGQWPPRQ